MIFVLNYKKIGESRDDIFVCTSAIPIIIMLKKNQCWSGRSETSNFRVKFKFVETNLTPNNKNRYFKRNFWKKMD